MHEGWLDKKGVGRFICSFDVFKNDSEIEYEVVIELFFILTFKWKEKIWCDFKRRRSVSFLLFLQYYFSSVCGICKPSFLKLSFH